MTIGLGFFGSSNKSLTVLTKLKQSGFAIKLVVTPPPRPVGRKQILTKTPPHTFAINNSIPTLTPEKLDNDFINTFKKYKLDVTIVADYAKLIPPEVLNHPKHGCLNLHPSLLPSTAARHQPSLPFLPEKKRVA